jgi:hypothetical protein
MPPPVPRQAGLLGRKPPHTGAPLPRMGDFLKAPLPTPAPSADLTNGLPIVWGMLGNDVHSDCADAGFYHLQAMEAASNRCLVSFPLDKVLQPYTQYCDLYNGGADDGVILGTWFQLLFSLGLCLGYGTCPLSEALAYATLGHGVGYGVNLTDSDAREFEQGVDWGTDSVQPDQNLGHFVALSGWTPASRRFVTWGSQQDASLQWEAECTEEVVVVVTHWDDTLDRQALETAIKALPGGVG